MVALWMAMFFGVSAALAWLALFPSARDGLQTRIGRLRSRVAATAGGWQVRAGGRAADSGLRLRGAAARLGAVLRRRRVELLLAAAVLALPALVVMLMRQQVVLEGYDRTVTRSADRHVLELLRGERLAPPPDLPPAVFTAADAELRSAPQAAAPEAISGADRRWQRIDPAFQQRVLAIYRVMLEQHGYRMVLVEGYRSPARQAELAARGGSVTRAGAGQSCHQYGLAVDSALYRDGKLQWDMEDPWTRRGYFLYGRLAEEAGLEWGGSWRSLKDYVHLEMKDACRSARRAAGAG